MSSAALVGVRRDGAVAIVELRRPAKLNALSTAVESELDAAIASAPVVDAACVVITGGLRAFSAGADVAEMRAYDVAAIAAYYRASGGVFERFAALPQPTVAAIEGWCLGGGLELALTTDVRVAAADAVFGLPEVAIGIVPSSGGLYRLVRAIGPARAKELILRSRRFDAAEAHRLGVVHELAPAGEALRHALAVAHELAGQPPLALAVAKEAIAVAAESSRDAALMIERLAYGMLAQTEAATAALDRLAPD